MEKYKKCHKISQQPKPPKNPEKPQNTQTREYEVEWTGFPYFFSSMKSIKANGKTGRLTSISHSRLVALQASILEKLNGKTQSMTFQ